MAIGDITFYPNYVQYIGFTASAEPSITGETYSCSGDETTGGAYDLVDNKRGTPVTIDTLSQTTQPLIDFDLSSTPADAFDFAILDYHNLATADGNVTIQYSTSSTTCEVLTAYSGALGEVLTSVSILPVTYFVENPPDGILIFTFTSQTSANWNFKFYAHTPSYDANLSIREAIIGKKYAVTIAPDLNPLIISNYHGVVVKKTPAGQNQGFGNYTGERKAWQLNWSVLSETHKNGILKVWQVCNGNKFPFYIDLGEAEYPKLYYVRFVDNSLTFRKLSAAAYEVSVMIESEV